MLAATKHRSVKNLLGKTVLILCLLAIPSLMHGGLQLAHASSSVNVIANPSFEQGLGPNPAFQVGAGPAQSPVGWDFTTCEGVANATVTLDSSRWVDGSQSAQVNAGPLTNTYCVPTSGTRTGTGFVQLRQFQTGGLTFGNLTDSHNAFSFWFYLQPSGSGGMAGFETRIFGAESIDELDYVFYHDPSLSYGSNFTGGAKAIILQGYQPGQWYQFSRDLRSDWLSVGLPLNYTFSLVDFEGLVIQNPGEQLKSETFWLDDVRVYAGTQLPPTETHYAYFNFTDTSGSFVDRLVKWKLFDWNGQGVTYSLGQSTLPTGPYFLEVYYLAYSADTMILREQIHLDSRQTIALAMIPNNSLLGGYLVLDSPIGSAVVSQPDSTRLQIVLQGPPATSNAMILRVATEPILIQGNGIDLVLGTDWTYDSSLSITRVSFTMSSGTENLTLFFKTPSRLPLVSFLDVSGKSLSDEITFKIFDSQGNLIPYSQGRILPTGSFLLEAYYRGYRIYRSMLNTNSNAPIMLEMLPLNANGASYLALNSTSTDVSISETSSSKIAFRIEGTGPYLIVIDVPEKPLYVNINGVPTVGWVYNGTTRTVLIETDSQGSFQVVFKETISSAYLYAGGVIGGIVTAGLAGTIAWRRKLSKRLIAGSPQQK